MINLYFVESNVFWFVLTEHFVADCSVKQMIQKLDKHFLNCDFFLYLTFNSDFMNLT
jgi:hypothetical protein